MDDNHQQAPVMQHNDKQSIANLPKARMHQQCKLPSYAEQPIASSLTADSQDETHRDQVQAPAMQLREPMNTNNAQMTSKNLQFSHVEQPSHGCSHVQVPVMQHMVKQGAVEGQAEGNPEP